MSAGVWGVVVCETTSPTTPLTTTAVTSIVVMLRAVMKRIGSASKSVVGESGIWSPASEHPSETDDEDE